ncbi:MAG: NUDIX hydrolase [Nocardioidaceae bacterium]
MTTRRILDDTEAASPRDVPEWLAPLAVATVGLEASAFSSFAPPSGTRPRAASVLVLFGGGGAAEGGRGEDAHVVLLERSASLRSHAGQVAFPGGAKDAGDPDDIHAALREAHEETGLDPAGVHVLTVLPPLWLPPSNYTVTPVIGWWRDPSPLHAGDPAETRSVHTVRLAALLDPRHRVTVRHPSGHKGPAFVIGELVVWGFTAGILSRLFALVGWEQPWDQTRVIALPERIAETSSGPPPDGDGP